MPPTFRPPLPPRVPKRPTCQLHVTLPSSLTFPIFPMPRRRPGRVTRASRDRQLHHPARSLMRRMSCLLLWMRRHAGCDGWHATGEPLRSQGSERRSMLRHFKRNLMSCVRRMSSCASVYPMLASPARQTYINNTASSSHYSSNLQLESPQLLPAVTMFFSLALLLRSKILQQSVPSVPSVSTHALLCSLLIDAANSPLSSCALLARHTSCLSPLEYRRMCCVTPAGT
mmetsp:Transcript_9242/g.20151  ORF Transcript_9242/g.20151 Transcript_9242/m.20151 type:complete len:228 (-) Transcript_9242:374-1057(-)